MLRKAVVYGTVLASFNVEAFSLERLRTLKPEEIAQRYATIRRISFFDGVPPEVARKDGDKAEKPHPVLG